MSFPLKITKYHLQYCSQAKTSTLFYHTWFYHIKSENEYVINAKASKGKKKNVFNDEILISNTDAERLKKYIKDNFMVYNVSVGAAK